MRITGGESRGRVIAGPEGLEVRPTGSKIRQAFFNILSNKVSGSRFVDICAGSGLMGFEALSRGAASLISVEESSKMAKSIQDNLRRLGYEGEVICADLCKVFPLLADSSADIIFADPPYKSPLAALILQLTDKHNVLAEDGLLAIEHFGDAFLLEETPSLVRYDLRKYGQTFVSFYRRKE